MLIFLGCRRDLVFTFIHNYSCEQNLLCKMCFIKSAKSSRQADMYFNCYHVIINPYSLFHLMSPSPPGDAENPSSPEPMVLEGQGSFKLDGWWLKLSQFHGLIVKRFHCAKRNTKGLFSQILLPAFFVCVAMTVALSVPEIGEILLMWLSVGFVPAAQEKENHCL